MTSPSADGMAGSCTRTGRPGTRPRPCHCLCNPHGAHVQSLGASTGHQTRVPCSGFGAAGPESAPHCRRRLPYETSASRLLAQVAAPPQASAVTLMLRASDNEMTDFGQSDDPLQVGRGTVSWAAAEIERDRSLASESRLVGRGERCPPKPLGVVERQIRRHRSVRPLYFQSLAWRS